MRIEQRHHQRVFQFTFTKTQPPARPADDMRRLRHRLHPTSQHHACFAQLDHLRGIHDRLHSRAAQTVHRQRWHLNRQPGFERNVARAIERVAGRLLRVAEHGMVKLTGINARAPNGFLAGNRSQFHSSKIFQLAAVAAHGRTRPTDNRDIGSLWHTTTLYEEMGTDRQTLEFNRRVLARANAATTDNAECAEKWCVPSSLLVLDLFHNLPGRRFQQAEDQITDQHDHNSDQHQHPRMMLEKLFCLGHDLWAKDDREYGKNAEADHAPGKYRQQELQDLHLEHAPQKTNSLNGVGGGSMAGTISARNSWRSKRSRMRFSRASLMRLSRNSSPPARPRP